MFTTKRLTKEGFILLGICLLFFLLRFPSLYEPYWYGDEGIYFTIAKAMDAGRVLYTQIWDNKPPLLYWFYLLFDDIFRIRLVSLVFGLSSVITFYFLSRAFFRKNWIAYITTTTYAVFFGLPTLEGNIANAENFMLFPIVLSALLLWTAEEKRYHHILHKTTLLFTSGLLLGTAFLFKTVAVFDFAAFFLFALFLHVPKLTSVKLLSNFLKSYAPMILGFLTPILLTSLVFFLQGNLTEFLETIFFRNVSYVGEKNDLLIPNGFLIAKLGLLISAIWLIFQKRKNLSSETMFVCLWVVFSLFNAFFSQRPYVHYQLVLLPSLSLALGLIFSYTSITKKFLALVPLSGIIIVLYLTFPHWHVNDAPMYYQNFLSYIRGQKSAVAYRDFFDRNTPRDYAVSAYLSQNATKNESIFLWGDSAQIYYLSNTLPAGRYAVAYHVITPTTIEETKTLMSHNPPRFLVVMPTSQPLPFMIHNYSYKLTIKDTAIYERNN